MALVANALAFTAPAVAGAAEEANAALDAFSAAYSSNDVEKLAQL